jgi:spermidine/putrescine transport system ATP-binding protein
VAADVELRSISKEFGAVAAVDGVSLQVGRGEFLTLLGPSGCGKTTVLRIVAGLEAPTRGEVFIRGDPMRGRAPYLRDCAIVFQQYALFPHKTVFDNVAFGLKYRGVPRRERGRLVQEMLELVRLPNVEQRYPRQLSGGQQQRVALARALVVRPSVLLLDEPLSNLDLKLREEMRAELRRLQEQTGITFIFVTHDQLEALSMSTRVAVMAHGRIVQLGTPAEIYEQPVSRFVAEFMGRSNFLEGSVVKPGHRRVSVTTASGLAIECVSPRSLAEGERVVVRVRADAVEVSTHPPSPGAANVVVGEVKAASYCGGTVEYVVGLAGGEELGTSTPIAGHGQIVTAGSRVWLWLPPEQCLALEAER